MNKHVLYAVHLALLIGIIAAVVVAWTIGRGVIGP